MQAKLKYSVIVTVACGIASLGCSGLPQRKASSEASLPSPRSTVAKATAGEAKPSFSSLFAGKPKKTAAETEAANLLAENEAEYTRGQSYESSGQYEKAKRLYQKMLTRDPRNARATHRLAVVADATKNYAEAEELFQRSIKLDSKNIEAYGDLGYCYFLQGKLNEAQASLTQAIALDPKNPLNHNNLGLVLGHMDRFDEAFNEFRVAGSEADAYYNMAFVFASKDHNDEAKECFRQALALKPDFKAAKDALLAFDKFERNPDDNHGEKTQLAEKRKNLVPYLEPGLVADAKSEASKASSGADAAKAGYDVQQASAQVALPRSSDVSRFTRALHQRSNSKLDHHMASQRGDTRTNQISGTPRAAVNGLQVSGGK